MGAVLWDEKMAWLLLVAAVVALWQIFLQPSVLFHADQFFPGRIEYLYMHNMSTWLKMALSHSPFLAHDAKQILAQDLSRHHEAHVEWYDPAKHNTVYRSLETDFLSRDECARIRDLASRHSMSRNDVEPSWEDSLEREFESVHVFNELLESNIISPEEKDMVQNVLLRLQKLVEKTFNSSTIMIDHADITRRQNPFPKKWSNTLRRLRYLATGGHGVHADQCSTGLAMPSQWSDRFVCENMFDESYCCAHRTHTVLLYLNDPDDGSLEGGEMYLVDRQDLPQDALDKPSYDGVGFSQQLKHTLRVSPTCGNVALFTSDARNFHGTLPIRNGARYAMPMWFSDPSLLHRQWCDDEPYLENFLYDFYERCEMLGSAMPIPSGFEEYVGDCKALIYAAIELAYDDYWLGLTCDDYWFPWEEPTTPVPDDA